MLAVLLLVGVALAEECQQICHPIWQPVCGSDHQTWQNLCELEAHACLHRSELSALYDGECHVMKTAEVTGCSPICTMEYRPVCGTDGQTYSNACELTSRACVTRSGVQVAFSGECMDVRTAPCQLMCPMNYSPVCGTDGRTYGNECEMRADSCLKRSGVELMHEGHCEEITDEEEEVEDECAVMCHFNYEPVCGTDGRTYGNECEMRADSCLKRSGVELMYEGHCEEIREEEVEGECSVMCHFNYEPVCGSDGRTYGNECEMRADSCLKRSGVELMHEGHCEEITEEEEEGCAINCHRNYDPVCGSDGRTYSNECELEATSCKQRKLLYTLAIGEC